MCGIGASRHRRKSVAASGQDPAPMLELTGTVLAEFSETYPVHPSTPLRADRRAGWSRRHDETPIPRRQATFPIPPECLY